ncbi:type IV toxin-antitoxin system AbiEi family antitoxin domain-containing protein [Gordonia westfalica]|uniref:Type IV toxin-antitoxin system AbiEi family antitoxin domain-containing protein n=1 Tax=Gordonia westfalica TaxID=158898 RepID=A0ABU2GXZ2_9ACTN|nr:type IV toxin-antitoxin system AbiEi family antitoxin domain-containing protein [Gordonia westfalica]MDS1115977.1 type IV toxin-antitoxin system AbiEi family antitoxin domain-containing protein [Gordonia westfalica]
MAIPAAPRTLALAHDGVVTVDEAHEHDLSNGAIGRRVKSGEWVRVAPGIYRLADHPATNRTRTRIATLSVSRDAVLSGLAAAWWHGVATKRPVVVTVTGPKSWKGSTVQGRKVIRRTLDAEDVVVHKGLRVTALPLSVLEGAVEGNMDVLDRALQREKVTVDALVETFQRRRNRKGAAEMAKMLVLVGSGARSAAERLAVDAFEQHGITGWIANHPAAGYVIDFAFAEKKVAVEIDGMAYHSDAAVFRSDRKRRNALIAAGWTVLNFTWADLVEQPGYVAAQVKYALRRTQSAG